MAGTAIKESETPPELRKEIMRDIKFRAWDKINKIMLAWEDIYGTPVAAISAGNGQTWESMQFIGLKDKNGKEIYESDIVKCIGIPDYEINSTNYEVHYNEDLAFVVSYSLSLTWGGWESVEVIGNKFENPELLNTKEVK